MKYRKLGASDLSVSEISLGSWLTFGVGVERDKAAACVERAFELGINFIDTANVYGRGAAETFLGEVLASRPRDSYVLATKVYFPMTATDMGLSRTQIMKQIDDSLRRLRTDYVDLYQCHRYDENTPLEETMQALTDVVKQGKRAMSVSANGSRRRSKLRSGSLEANASFQVSRNIRCCGASRKKASFPSAPRMAFRRLSGRHWRKACLPESISSAPSRRRIRAQPTIQWALT